MNSRSLPRFFSVFMVSALLFGCGDGSETRPRYSSGVAGDAQVSTLDDTQQRELCESFDVYATTYVDLEAIAYLACFPAAVFTTATPEACQSALDQCVAAFPDPITVTATAHSEQLCFSTLDQCNATVAQLEGCANVNVDRALEIYRTWSCGRVTDPEFRSQAEAMNDLVNVCADVDAACNRFAEVGPD